MTDKELDDLMNEHFDTNEYAGDVKSWRDFPQLDEEEDDVAKSSPTPAEAHVPEIASALRRRKKSRLPVEKGTGLYVCRPLLNAVEVQKWLDSFGFHLEPEPHVTIIYSDKHIVWGPQLDTLVIAPNRLYRLQKLGKDGAVVIPIDSWELQERWLDGKRMGAESSFPTYKPHLTLFYDPENKVDFSGLTAPTFPLVLGPEIQGHRDATTWHTIAKMDEDKRLVTGWASIIENPDGSPVVDSQGDVIDEDELVRAAHDFMGRRTAGEMHRKLEGIGTIVESLVVTKALKVAMGLPADTPTGWLITVKVDSDDTWKQVKSGELAAFSIGGSAIREKM